MKFCNQCGKLLFRVRLPDDDYERCICSSCGYTHYQNPRVLVVSLVFWSGHLLMCRRAKQPGLDKWIPPSGFLEIGETLQEGAARETREETGVDIDPNELDLYSVMNMVAIEQVAIWFRCELTKPAIITPGAECTEVAFIPLEEVPKLDIAWRDSVGDATSVFIKQCRSHEFAITLMNSGAAAAGSPAQREYKIVANSLRGLKGACST